MSIHTEHAKRFLASCGIRITGKYKGRYVPLWDKEPHSTRAHAMNMRNLKPSSPGRVNGKSWKRFIEH